MRMPWVVFVQDLLWESVGRYFSALPFPLDLRQLWGEKQQKKKNEKGQAEIQESSQVVKTQPSLHQEKGESQDIYVRLWILSRGFWRPGMLLLFTDTADLGLCQGRRQAEEGGLYVCLSLLGMKYVFFPLPLALPVTVAVCKISISPVEWWGCPNPKFEGMGCSVTFIFGLLCILLRFCSSVPMKKCSKYIFCFCNGDVWNVPFWFSFVYGYTVFLISSIW